MDKQVESCHRSAAVSGLQQRLSVAAPRVQVSALLIFSKVSNRLLNERNIKGSFVHFPSRFDIIIEEKQY